MPSPLASGLERRREAGPERPSLLHNRAQAARIRAGCAVRASGGVLPERRYMSSTLAARRYKRPRCLQRDAQSLNGTGACRARYANKSAPLARAHRVPRERREAISDGGNELRCPEEKDRFKGGRAGWDFNRPRLPCWHWQHAKRSSTSPPGASPAPLLQAGAVAMRLFSWQRQ